MSCQSNQLTSLNVAGTALEILYCHSNQLTSLDVSGLTVLETLYCYINQLSSLDVSSLTALETLYCFSNQLTSLNVAGLTALERIRCYSNNLTSLTLGSGPYHYVMAHDNPALTDLSVGDDFDAQGGYSMGYHGVYSQDGVTLHNTALSGATLNAFYQKLTATPTSGYYGAGYIYLKNVEDPGTNPCVGWDSDNPSLAPVAWTIYGT
jgi:Leucine-rich repeat (LRR) protein